VHFLRKNLVVDIHVMLSAGFLHFDFGLIMFHSRWRQTAGVRSWLVCLWSSFEIFGAWLFVTAPGNLGRVLGSDFRASKHHFFGAWCPRGSLVTQKRLRQLLYLFFLRASLFPPAQIEAVFCSQWQGDYEVLCRIADSFFIRYGLVLKLSVYL